jgi:hypothetical protein
MGFCNRGMFYWRFVWDIVCGQTKGLGAADGYVIFRFRTEAAVLDTKTGECHVWPKFPGSPSSKLRGRYGVNSNTVPWSISNNFDNFRVSNDRSQRGDGVAFSLFSWESRGCPALLVLQSWALHTGL